MADDLLIGAVLFTILSCLLCVGSILCIWILALNMFGDPPAPQYPSWKECTYSRIVCCCISPSLVISIILMWLIYDGVIKLNDQYVFWLIAALPFGCSFTICCYAAKQVKNDKIPLASS